MLRKSFLALFFGFPVAAFAQLATPTTHAQHVQDFMSAIPMLDEVPYEAETNRFGVSRPIHREHMAYHYRRADVVAHSFIRDIGRKDRRGETLGVAALSEFARICVEKGGYLEPENCRTFEATLRHLFDDAYYSLWHKGLSPADPVFDLAICSASSEQAFGALTVTRDRITNQTAIVLFGPTAVLTQADLDRRRAAREEEARREISERQREADRLHLWRENLTSGTETSCGPVLSINGNLVQIIESATRQTAWYRRSELLPAQNVDGKKNYCR